MNTALSLRHATVALIRLLIAVLLLTAWAGLPDSLYSAPEASSLYVAPGGSDSNACTSAASPCEHIQAAINKAASGYTIIIAAGTYIEQLTITDKNLTVQGQGAASTFLDGNKSFSILSIHREAVPSVTVNLSGVTLRNGSTNDAGGAIAIEAKCSLTLSNSVIAGNTTTSSGGGILNVGTLKLINVTVRANRASLEGGGIFNSGNLQLSNVLLTDNDASRGGGISNRVAVTVTTSLIISNTSSGLGGGIYNPAGSLVLLNSTLSGNAAIGDGGAIYNGGILTSTKTVIKLNQAANFGGGIYNFTASKITLAGNAILNNTALFGGGLFNGGVAQIDGTSITNNVANNSGGGLNNASSTAMTNVTVSDNTAPSGSGILNSGALSMKFSTISHNNLQASGGVTAGNSILDNACSAPIASTGYNIDTGTSCGFAGPNDLSSTNPQLGPLQDNGGETFTRAIALSSAAVDSANDGVCPPIDQRGLHRPQGDHCDRGAYEMVGYSKSNTLDIGYGACVTSILPIADNYSVGRILVGVNLTYAVPPSNRSDLRIRLLSPGSLVATLLGPAANPGHNLDTMFDDSAPTIVPAGDQNPAAPPYYENVYKPTTPLARMRGTGIKGNWKLEICSSSAIEYGTLNRWTLVVPEVMTSFKIYLPLVRR